jgi:hypothetical protein
VNRARPAGDVEDATAIGEQRQQRLGEEERPLDLDADQLVELLLGGLGERRVDADAGVVDEEVKAVGAEVGERVVHRGRERREAGGVGDVERQS